FHSLYSYPLASSPIYTLSLHDALPISLLIAIMIAPQLNLRFNLLGAILIVAFGFLFVTVSSRLTGEIGSSSTPTSGMMIATLLLDRKSTRLNSSHVSISYAVFCLKKKK